MFLECSGAFKQNRTLLRAKDLAVGLINCLGRRTISGLLTSCGKIFEDWSAEYRLFYGQRMELSKIFDVVRKKVLDYQPNSGNTPIYGHMDDTLLKKTGKKVAGTSWKRDPLGPPFHTNFIWAQRFIQISLSLPDGPMPCANRSIPVDFFHSPTVQKPKKKDSGSAWKEYKEKQKIAKLSVQGSKRITLLRENLDREGAQERPLIMSVDGSYSNETVLKGLPERTTLIGRIRKDAKLNKLPELNKGAGRNRVYGQPLPTPEEIRQSKEYLWQEVRAFATGKTHCFKVKVVKDIRWRKSSTKNLQLVVIRPLGYRLTKNSKMLYRQPAYLICTDPNLDIGELLQAYLWRWGIEVNFREEKTLLGCGQAQVRNSKAVEKVPAFVTAVYSMIQLADYHTSKAMENLSLPRAKWYPVKAKTKKTTGDIINNCRSQMWAKSAEINFSDFVNLHLNMQSRKIRPNHAQSVLMYSRK